MSVSTFPRPTLSKTAFARSSPFTLQRAWRRWTHHLASASGANWLPGANWSVTLLTCFVFENSLLMPPRFSLFSPQTSFHLRHHQSLSSSLWKGLQRKSW